MSDYTALAVLIAAFALPTALALWADHAGWDPFTRLYGSDYTAPWADREPGDLP